ncbi:Het domain protein [Apiospora saccharicola]|uniref:Het domain protein n=1 Tax=Apiospora saccharicola TaxID=335842 RepID=A0ABR1TGV2_9PEZI
MHGPTELREEGLFVQYPGFKLYCNEIQRVLLLDSNTLSRYGFTFPVDSDFHEWYRVEAADEPNKRFMATLPLPGDEDKKLTIIVSRPQPRERLPDIGLLVQVDEIASNVNEGDAQRTDTIYCKIISRVKIRRVQSGDNSVLRIQDNEVCYGEALSVNQKWVVDGFDHSDGDKQISRTGRVLATVRTTLLR